MCVLFLLCMDGMEHIIIETPRLLLREMTFSDMQDLSLILQDERVMYAYNGAFSDEETEIWMRRQIQRYADFGFGLWAIVLKSAGKMIGQCGITMQGYKNLQVPEIGYLLAYDFWHCGYARETVNGCKKYAKVAESVGMSKEDEFITQYYNGDMLHYLYSIRK